MNKKYTYTPILNSESSPAKIISLIAKNSNVLEIGCSTGSQTKVLTELLGCTVTGIEINPDAAAEASNYCEKIIIGNIEDIDLKETLGNSRYDFIIIADVLEHLYNPKKTLNKLSPYLSKNGKLVASIPNVAYIGLIFDLANGKFDYRQFGLLDDTHIRFFTKKNIYNLFESAGFSISALDRVTCHPLNSEFKTTAADEEDKNILKYIENNNSEHDTYQFIIKATVANSPAIEEDKIQLQEEIIKLQKKLESNKKEIRKLESNIDWLEQSSLKKLIKKFRSVIE